MWVKAGSEILVGSLESFVHKDSGSYRMSIKASLNKVEDLEM